MAENRAEIRPELVADVKQSFGVVEKPLTLWERIYNQGAFRKGALLVALALIWELYARKVDNPLLETACPENNQDFFHQNLFPIPEADKPDF